MTEHTTPWDRLWSRPAGQDHSTATTRRGRASEPAEAPSPGAVLRALDDDKCRVLLDHLDEPKTASELIEQCDLSSSTVYRKLDRLRDASLVCEYTEIRRSGTNATVYERDVARVAVTFSDDGTAVEIERPPADATDRMARFFTEMHDQA